MKCDVQKRSLLLIQEDVSIVVQKKCNSFSVPFPCCKVERRVLREKQNTEETVTTANCYLVMCCLVSLLKCIKEATNEPNYLILK
jgi:hypothetical protein